VPEWGLKQNIKTLLVFLAVGLAVYANSFHSPFIWDDPYLIRDNHLIKSLRYLPDLFQHHLYYSTAGLSNFYRPLQSLFLMVDFSFWGERPLGYHLTSFGFHLACAFMAAQVVRTLLGRPWVGVLTGLIFLVHPINSTVVNYIASRADMQVALGMLLSCWLCVWSLTHRQRLWYIGALVAFVAALLISGDW